MPDVLKVALGKRTASMSFDNALKKECARKRRTFVAARTQSQREETTREMIQFDATFDANNSRSVSGIVVLDWR
ncbi:hypothetical protein J1N35_003901, partial [Gossypium stocksii]